MPSDKKKFSANAKHSQDIFSRKRETFFSLHPERGKLSIDNVSRLREDARYGTSIYIEGGRTSWRGRFDGAAVVSARSVSYRPTSRRVLGYSSRCAGEVQAAEDGQTGGKEARQEGGVRCS